MFMASPRCIQGRHGHAADLKYSRKMPGSHHEHVLREYIMAAIDEDRNPPCQLQLSMAKKRAPKPSNSGGGFSFQDTLSSSDLRFNMAMTPGDHSGMGSFGSFQEFSTPKTPFNLPKTPDIKNPSSSSSSTSWIGDSGKLTAGPGPLFGNISNFGVPGLIPENPLFNPAVIFAARSIRDSPDSYALRHQQFPKGPSATHQGTLHRKH